MIDKHAQKYSGIRQNDFSIFDGHLGATWPDAPIVVERLFSPTYGLSQFHTI